MLELDPQSPLQSKGLMEVYAFVIIGGWQFCFRPKDILLFVCLFSLLLAFSFFFLFFFFFFSYRFNFLVELHFLIFFYSLPVSFLYNLFIWITLTPHVVAIIPLCLKHISNKIKVTILFPHILNSEYSTCW